MVMGSDSRSNGCGFESRHRILDRHFFTNICCKNCNVCLKRPKINKKRGRGWPIFLKNKKSLFIEQNKELSVDEIRTKITVICCENCIVFRKDRK